MSRPDISRADISQADICRAVATGLAYGGGAFAIGFALGIPRTLLLEPHLGSLASVLLELPVVLFLCWAWCRWLMGRRELPTAAVTCWAMGLTGLGLLLLLEIVMLWSFTGSFRQAVAGFQRPDRILGLAGQLVFAAMPWLQARGNAPRPTIGPTR